MHGAGEHSIIFVNDYLLAEMHLSEYASLEVPEGSVVISGTLPVNHIVPPSITGFWASLPSCASLAGLDWRRWAEALPADVAPCRSELTKLVTECRVRVETEGSFRPGSVRITKTIIPSCNYKLIGMGDAIYLLETAPFLPHAVATAPEGETSPSIFHQNGPIQVQLRFDAEAGKTYYVKYSFDASFSAHTHLELMEASRGVKEMRSLRLAHLAED
jgi:hypothetical protein